MHLPRKYVVAGLLALTVAPSAHAVTVAKTRTVDMNSNVSGTNYQVPYFTQSADGLTSISPSSNGWAPTSPTQAGTVTSTTISGLVSLAGNATSAGNWQDGNGVPAGLTLSFNAQFTISVGPNAPSGSLLTMTTNTPADFGNGLGVTQSLNGISQMEVNEELQMSPFTISNLAFSGTMTETGFTVGTPSVPLFGTRVFRSAGFNGGNPPITSEKALLTSAGGTIGFADPSQQPYGDVSSNIGNNFSNTFPVQAGPYTLAMTSGAMGLKGIGFSYDYTFDVNPDVVADNADFDDDDDVDGADFLIWQENLGLASDATRAQGNANPTVDGDVDGDDLGVWTAQYGTTPPAISVATAVPEPAAAVLSAFAVLSALAVRKRN